MSARRPASVLTGLINKAAAPGLLDLVDHYAGPHATVAEVSAAVERVRREVPGPFEPQWSGTQGVAGLEEFRRRYPDPNAAPTAPERFQTERLDRDARQVREALLGVTR